MLAHRGQKPVYPEAILEGRLSARPSSAEALDIPATAAPTGLQQLDPGTGREGFLYVPAGYSAAQPTPLVLSLRSGGAPRFFVSHGTRDQVLPIDRCSRRIVPQLRAAGYDVSYHEFGGDHTVPKDITRAAIDWFRR